MEQAAGLPVRVAMKGSRGALRNLCLPATAGSVISHPPLRALAACETAVHKP